MKNEVIQIKKEKSKEPSCRLQSYVPLTVLFSIFFLLFSFGNVLAQGFDFGLLLNQDGSYGNSINEDGAFVYNAGLIPRFSIGMGENANLFLSFALNAEYDEEFAFVPELMRTEFSLNSGAWGFSAGRFTYTDPSGFISSGLFDGARITRTSSAGRIGFGAWYTGLLYKKTANITMTQEDQSIYFTELDFNDFADTYFAPKRVFAALDYEHPSIKEIFRLKTSLIGQIDLSNEVGKLHSQYLVIKAGLPVSRFLFEAGGSFMLLQAEGKKNKYNQKTAFAFDAAVNWTLPSSFNSRLSFTTRYASGNLNKDIYPFIPVTTKYTGEVFQAKLTALTVFSLNYTARFARAVGAGITASYFTRNDLVTSNSYPITSAGDGGYFLGAEAYAQIVWSPVSDLQFVLGGGAFIPQLGDNWKNEEMKWKINLSAALAIM